MNQTQLVRSVFDGPLSEFGYSIETSESGFYRYRNLDTQCDIYITRGPMKYYRIRYESYGCQYMFGLDDFSPQYGLENDMMYDSEKELKNILHNYLSATIKYAIPLLDRLPVPKPMVTMDMDASLCMYVEKRAARWADKNHVSIFYSKENVNTLQKDIAKIRSGDYSKQHFDEVLEDLLDAAAYMGEMVIAVCKNASWGWDEHWSGEGYFVFSKDIPLHTLSGVWQCWMSWPELSRDGIEDRCEAFFMHYGFQNKQ